MVAEVAENVELEESQNTWSGTGNLDNREDSVSLTLLRGQEGCLSRGHLTSTPNPTSYPQTEMTSTALADVCSEQEEKTVILHQTPEVLEEQQTEELRTGNLNVLNWLPLSKLYPFFYRLNGPYPMQVFTV